MNKKLLIVIAFIINSLANVNAQNQNSLAFDGVDDFVTIPNGSGYVTGLAEMSITCWIYPTNGSVSFPNYDGFAGFRNDVDADFYLVQVGNSALEGRFRNSSGVAYTITKPILTLNTWQHIAMTYADGTLSMYKNGILIGDTAAAGIVSNANVDFNIGNVVFTGATFWLTGRMDETSFWSRELSASEIRCMPTSGIDTASSGLIFYYKYNQGIASGVNTAITTLNDEKGAINGTLNGFALTGAASNFVAGYSAAVTNTFGFTCPDVAYTWNGQQYTTQGTYQDTLVSAAGCDSIVQLQLVLLFVDTAVNATVSTLTANHTGTFYQWLDCNNGNAPIAGATFKSFTPTAVGSYSVIIGQSGCFDTSSCYTITTVGLNSLSTLNNVRVYPTVTNSNVRLSFDKTFEEVKITVVNLTGKEMLKNTELTPSEINIDFGTFAKGIYFVSIQTAEGIGTYKIIKQ
jgi:hypothetical protein